MWVNRQLEHLCRPLCLLVSSQFESCVICRSFLVAVNMQEMGIHLGSTGNFFVKLPLPFMYELICIIVADCTFSNMDGFLKHNVEMRR